MRTEKEVLAVIADHPTPKIGGGVMNISHGMVNTLLGTTTAKAHAPIILEESEDDPKPMGCSEQAHPLG